MAALSIDRNGTSVTVAVNHLDSRRRARGEKGQHPLPVVGRPETKPEEILIFRLSRCLACNAANLSGRPMVNLANAGVEPPNRPEAGSQRKFVHRQTGLINQFFGEV